MFRCSRRRLCQSRLTAPEIPLPATGTPSPSCDPAAVTRSGSAPESTPFQTTSFFLPYSFPVSDTLDPLVLIFQREREWRDDGVKPAGLPQVVVMPFLGGLM